MTINDGGIFRVPMADYIADKLCPVPSLSSGCAHTLITQSPLHAWHHHPRLGGKARDQSSVADTGSTAHDMLLGGEGKICVIEPNDYPSKNGEVPKGWTNTAIRAARDLARSNGLTPILAVEMAGVRAMVAAGKQFIASSDISKVFDSGESELTVISREDQTFLRTRPDWLNLKAGISLSYKTTKTKVHADSFHRLIDSMGYGFALMFYDRVLRSHGHDVRHIILAQEQTAPWACQLFELSKAKAQIERNQVDRAIRLWGKCMDEGKWPSYPGSIVSIEPRSWDLAAEEARLIEDEEQRFEMEGAEA